jgi:hypothetical protein
MASFNRWIALYSAALDDSNPMLPQLQQLNDARACLENTGSTDMKVNDRQYSFILLKALPDSYSTIPSTILAAGEVKDLDPKKIQERILNEESRHSSASTSLNKIAPIKQKGNKADKDMIKCFYCKKKGHKANECRKKKKDEEEKEKKEKKEKENSAQKSINAHIGTATIEEISDDDNDDLPISIYATVRSRWMVDSGATHHITPHRSDFIDWHPQDGTVSLREHAEIRQIGSGTVAIRPSGGDKIVHLRNVMHVPDAGARYFSVGAFMLKGGRLVFEDKHISFQLRGKQIAKGYQEGTLFWIDTSNADLHAIADAPTPLQLWHERMGHMSTQALKCYKDSVQGITFDASISQD